MPHLFYSSLKYKEKQSFITKENWKKGKYISLLGNPEKRFCLNPICKEEFFVNHSDPKKFCSHGCSAYVGNMGRKLSILTRLKISKAIRALPRDLRRGYNAAPRIKLHCFGCQKEFSVLPYLAKTQKYCSIHCNIVRLGKQTTSAKASKGKNGIRKDIDPNINFYSTWEANIARVFNLVGLKWEFSPKIFDLGEHTYRPDFYLPDFDMFIEVKNFLNEYSLKRDSLFRKKLPNIKLELILKSDYVQIKENYKDLVDNWEY